MPGWYIHMDVARKAAQGLPGSSDVSTIFGSLGPSAADIAAIAQSNPAYVALGAIGPDLFFLLPDFKPPLGGLLWGAASTVREIYDWLDENFIGPWENEMGPVLDGYGDIANALSGGLIDQIGDIANRAAAFIKEALEIVVIRQADLFALLGSGVPAGFDEQTFFWSDMLHYRQTFRIATRLWQRASEADPEWRPRFQAYALGWMAHLGGDVVGHAFVNQKVGGPYRLHWQRHHLVENHMDARVYGSEFGTGSIYNAISCSALHLWLAINPDGSSRQDMFQPQPGPTYLSGDETPDELDRKSKWDVDPELPEDLAKFLAETLRDVYTKDLTKAPTGQVACCPTIISELDERVPIEGNGYPEPEDIDLAHYYMFHYIKAITTDYYTMQPPAAPDPITIAPFPSPPGTGASDPGPGASDPGLLESIWDLLLAIFAWLAYLVEVIIWALSVLPSLIAGLTTYAAREVIYELVQLPLYNMWLALHYYLAMTGYVMPLPDEINIGLTRLGSSAAGSWPDTLAALDLVDGGLISPTANEGSGSDVQRDYPKDVVADRPVDVSPFASISAILSSLTGAGEPKIPSEFTRPWQFPDLNQAGAAIHSEFARTKASPYQALTDVLDFMASMPGSGAARDQLESATSAQETSTRVMTLLASGETLGDPVDYVQYIMARLTRDGVDASRVANFNLDADRGYGHLTWDWARLNPAQASKASPNAFKGTVNPVTGVVDDVSQRAYPRPARPGYGWDPTDIDPDPLPPNNHRYQPTSVLDPVRIRYIDREGKFV